MLVLFVLKWFWLFKLLIADCNIFPFRLEFTFVAAVSLIEVTGVADVVGIVFCNDIAGMCGIKNSIFSADLAFCLLAAVITGGGTFFVGDDGINFVTKSGKAISKNKNNKKETIKNNKRIKKIKKIKISIWSKKKLIT